MPTAAELLSSDFATLPDLVRAHAAERPTARAAADGDGGVTWGELDAMVDRIAARLQDDGVARRARVAVAGANSVDQIAVILAALRCGACAALVTNSATGPQMAAMIRDAAPTHLFLDNAVAAALTGTDVPDLPRIAMDGSAAGVPLEGWMAPPGSAPQPVAIAPADDFNIIYSSGTTGTPKGIVHSHEMRWQHIVRGVPAYGPRSVTILSTPLYSNTTMAAFLPAIGSGGTAVLMARFDAGQFLMLAERERATNAMLVPVQYRRILAHPDFDRRDLTSFVMKYCTSAPFSADLKREVLDRWPGGLVEIYGMTEGGGVCLLEAHRHPDKLHTVGCPAPGHDMRVIDEDGRELPPGSVGEIVGRSATMMTGYNNRPDATSAMHWRDASGQLFYRQGDVGRFDEDGFLVLMDRAKDMIISGGFNIFPSDLEAVLERHPDVIDAAVVGVPSDEWGETPVAFVVLRDGSDAETVRAAVNAEVGKTQRLSAIHIVADLPRSPIGKVLKRELRDGLR